MGTTYVARPPDTIRALFTIDSNDTVLRSTVLMTRNQNKTIILLVSYMKSFGTSPSGNAFLIILSLAIGVAPNTLAAERLTAPDFEREIAPIIVRRCLECHQDRDPSGRLVLTTRSSMLKGGRGGPAIVSGDSEESYLISRITSGEMPPEIKGVQQHLPDNEITLLRRWIQAGAPWPEQRTLDLFEATTDVRGGRDWWSLQPVIEAEPPTMNRADLVENPIDAFVLAALEQADLEPAPLASKRNQIRRIYYDVIGLPPTYEQVNEFVSDEREDAWERVVDELLNSPQFGERWARHWLDLVRFAETSGYERDQVKTNAWRYRDWVVNALNDDMPYDRFVLEQLAGDELPDRSEQTVIATGFMRLGTWNDEPNDAQDYKYERLEDLVHVTSSAFLGLTVKCARCHDHKFDPILQEDYYRIAATFWPGPIEPRDANLLGGPTVSELGYENILGWTDLTGSPPPIHLLKQGKRDKPGEIVEAGSLSAVAALFKSFDPPPAEATSTTRRLQLARWIIDKKNPLTARVLVNRIWQHHFGAGLVRTPNNFGFRGDLPTHPGLLDWLASEIVRGGWRMKPIHKQLLMSRTYRQSVAHPRHDEYQLRNASNKLLWRSERRRLDAEALRDSMLLVTGELDESRGGPSFRSTVNSNALKGLSRKDAAWQASPMSQQRRRSLYMFSQRSLLLPFMTSFNFSDTISPCGRRDVTISPTQALALLNNSFSHDRSTALANRVIESAAANPAEKVRMTWRISLGRMPTSREEQLSLNHLDEQRERFKEGETDPQSEFLALASLCHVLLNSNEFIFVD